MTPLRAQRVSGGFPMEARSYEHRKHLFAITGSADFLSVIRELFQEENTNITTTNFVPNASAQIAALKPDALVVDIVTGQQAGWELLERLHAEAVTTGIPVMVISTDPRRLAPEQEAAMSSLAETRSVRYLTGEFGVSHETVRAERSRCGAVSTPE